MTEVTPANTNRRQEAIWSRADFGVYILVFIFIGCGQRHIRPDSVDKIALIQVDHPYIGHRVDSTVLDEKLVGNFLDDFADRREEVTKFNSCYVIKIYLKDGQIISYRTNGLVFEKFKDESTTATYFKLNKDENLITKYWGIPKEQFCSKTITENYRLTNFGIGKTLFTKHCSSCHYPPDQFAWDAYTFDHLFERLPEPADEYFIKYIQNSKGLKASGDAYARKLDLMYDTDYEHNFKDSISEKDMTSLIYYIKQGVKLKNH
jgi:hypothetical protein